jgi:hypothetical protein
VFRSSTSSPDSAISFIISQPPTNSFFIESSLFNDLSKIKQHQLVYKSLDGLMDSELHAMQLKTKGTK